ncbi:RICIN domain-containing protein [Streptomyces sp. WM6386]|uniref:RICIN domain-containing protein n=1 Tax=Streptomyces sp. WM6386 TaxID=1415558 RepID=UPI00131E3906|nr:RICIN domain-containing protein [Streptomyces sp. WM6386]
MPIRTLIITVLVTALAATLLDASIGSRVSDAARRTSTSVTQLCEGTVDAVEAAYGTQTRPVANGPVVESAAFDTGSSTGTVSATSYALTTHQVATLAAKKKEAVTDCTGKLHNVAQAKWSYLSARAVEIAVDAAITILASTLICSLTGPVGCKWGVRFASFVGGFVGALAFQYLTDGYINWTSVGGAFFDATVSMLTFSGLDKLDESYVGRGVRATLKSAGQAIKAVGARIGGAGPNMVGSVQNALNYVMGHNFGAFPIAYTGGGSVEPVIAEKRGQPIANGLQFRIPSHASGSPVHDDLYSGSWNSPYYNWDVAETPHYNKDGAVGYLIGQGSKCLGYTSSGYAVLKTCNYNDSTQWWFVDGDELMANNGKCMGEVENSQSRQMGSCDGLTYQANPENFDDQFIVTPPGGTYIPNTVFNWKSHLSYYEHA